MTSLPPDPTSPEAAEDPARPAWDSPPPPTADQRTRKRKWRRRRRVLGTLAFLAVVGVLFYVVAQATGIGQDDGSALRDTTTTVAPTTTTLPPAGPYRVLDGLNARSGPGSTFPAVGVIEIGHLVTVRCVAEGALVNGPTGQSTKWLKVPTPFGDIWLTAAYVSVGADLANPAKIPPCAP